MTTKQSTEMRLHHELIVHIRYLSTSWHGGATYNVIFCEVIYYVSCQFLHGFENQMGALNLPLAMATCLICHSRVDSKKKYVN